MKNAFKLLGIAVLVTAIGFSISGCDNDPDPTPPVIPALWAGAYTGGSDIFTLHSNGSASWSGWLNVAAGSWSGVSLVDGGTLTNGGVNIGTWMYVRLAADQTVSHTGATPVSHTISAGNVGIVLRWNVAGVGAGQSIGIGAGAIANIISGAQGMGTAFNPAPNTAGMPAPSIFSFGGDNDPEPTPPVIPALFSGTYTGGIDTFILHPDGMASWTSWLNVAAGSWSGVSLVDGGTLTNGGVNIGTWMYVRLAADQTVSHTGATPVSHTINAGNVGIVLQWSVPGVGAGQSIGIGIGTDGFNGVSKIISDAQDLGSTFNPAPNTAGMPAADIFSFGGNK